MISAVILVLTILLFTLYGLSQVYPETELKVFGGTNHSDAQPLEDLFSWELNNVSTPKIRKRRLVILNSVWGPWTFWSKCSSNCGRGGLTVRRRSCHTLPEIPCDGMSYDIRTCNRGLPCQATFSSWKMWGPCSVTCGAGVRARSRICLSESKQRKCKGLSSLLVRCTRPECPPPTTAPTLRQGYPMMPQYPGAGFMRYLIPVHFLGYYRHPFRSVNRSTKVSIPRRKRILIPRPPVRAPPKFRVKLSPRLNPFLWGDWGHWSQCSASCGVGSRIRVRLCIDNSHKPPSKVLYKWCGQGFYVQSQGCVGDCKRKTSLRDSERFPAKIGILETGSNKGPYVRDQYKHDLQMKVSRAEVVETANRFEGPRVVSYPDNDKTGELTRLQVEETGSNQGPLVLTAHENEPETMLPPKEENSPLPSVTYLFIVLFLLCLVLIITALCIYFYQRISEYRIKKKIKEGIIKVDDDEIVKVPGSSDAGSKSVKLKGDPAEDQYGLKNYLSETTLAKFLSSRSERSSKNNTSLFKKNTKKK